MDTDLNELSAVPSKSGMSKHNRYKMLSAMVTSSIKALKMYPFFFRVFEIYLNTEKVIPNPAEKF